METQERLAQFYENYDEEGRLLSRHGSVEFSTTMRYIEKYLRPGMRVMEIGTATGRYAHTIARMGYEVDAVELVRHNIELFLENTQEGERIRIRQSDARSLSYYQQDTFDITLLLGPMYHLFTKEDQMQALSEALRVTKPGGILMVAYCGNEATMIQYCFGKGMLREEKYQKLVDPVTFKANSDPSELFELYRKEEIDDLMSNFHTERLHFVGTDMATNYMRQTIDEMDEELFQKYLKYHFTICERADCVGVSHHFLDIHRKEG